GRGGEAAVAPVQGLPEGGGGGDVAGEGRERVGEAGEVLPAAGREVVEDAHALAPFDEGAREVRADEAGSAGDEVGRHERLLSPPCWTRPRCRENLHGISHIWRGTRLEGPPGMKALLLSALLLSATAQADEWGLGLRASGE